MKQQNRSLLISLLAAFAVLFSACGSDAAADLDDGSGPAAGLEDSGVVTDVRTQPATYQSATVYAGSTDFYFEDSAGNLVEFRVSNLPEDQTIELPDNMLEADVVEGPPGANPDLVGQEFLLTYDGQDQLVRVERNN